MDYKITDDGIIVSQNCFDLAQTLDCGQAFRWSEREDGSFEGDFLNEHLVISEIRDGEFLFHGITEEKFLSVWKDYFDFDTDYSAIIERLSEDETLAKACRFAPGIRILRQDAWEALCSFIISQNNNIPRIKKIVTSLCEKYGEDGAFPTPEAIYGAGVDGIFALKTGFRAGYIIDAAEKVLSGKIDFSEIENSDDYDYCTSKLCSIKGVGPKVSSCVLLFGFGKTEAFPIDVWMKRSIERHFSDEFDPKLFGRYAGIAQQYLFYYERWLGGGNI